MSGLVTEPLCPASLSGLGVLTSCRTRLVKESVEGWLVIAASKTTAQLCNRAGGAFKAATSSMVSLILKHIVCCMDTGYIALGVAYEPVSWRALAMRGFWGLERPADTGDPSPSAARCRAGSGTGPMTATPGSLPVLWRGSGTVDTVAAMRSV